MIQEKKELQNPNLQNPWRLKLDENENIYGCLDSTLSVIKNTKSEDISHFSNSEYLTTKFSSKYQINKNNILFTANQYETLDLAIQAYLKENEEILAYESEEFIEKHKIRVKKAKYNNRFIFNKDELLSNISYNTKIIYISTPNTQTGEVIKASKLEILIKKFQELLFVIDCSYVNFSYHSAFEDYIELTKKYDNVIIFKSYSYDFSLAGLNIGVTIASENIINRLKKVIIPNNINSIALNCALMCINDDKKIIEIKELNQKAKEYLSNVLTKQGFKTFESESNFILCDFGDYQDFYYNKFKNSAIITKKYSPDSSLSTCLRITIPTLGGVKYLAELLNQKDVLILSEEELIFNNDNSYLKAIAQTTSNFLEQKIDISQIIEFKKENNINCIFETTKFLLEENGIYVSTDEIIKKYKEIYCDSYFKLYENDKPIISKETLEKLSKKYDLALYSNRFKNEVEYSLKKYDFEKYFCYFLFRDDLAQEELKPNSYGIENILCHCPSKNIKFIAPNIEDIIAANKAQVESIAVINPKYDYNTMVNNFKHLGVSQILNKIDDIENLIIN